MRRLVLAVLVLLAFYPAAGRAADAPAQAALDPNMPANITSSRRSVLEHGLRLVKDGNAEFARAHFTGAVLAKPCKVQLVLEGVPDSQRPAYLEAARAGLALWGAALPDFVRFEEGRTPEECPVQIFFVPTVASPDEKTRQMKYVCGMTREEAPHVGLTVPHRWGILVAMHPNSGPQFFPPQTITHVVAHELGHVIGIGEIDDPRNIMGPNARVPAVTLSNEDIALARSLLEYERGLVTRYCSPTTR
jgi:hypothetical protein